MKQKVEEENVFPISKQKTQKGVRKILRSKVLQVLYAFFQNHDDLDRDFSHIFYREFNFGDNEEVIERLLKPSEVYELEADVPIIWKDDDVEFAKDLVRFSVNNFEKIGAMIQESADNWDLERISLIDKIIIVIAASEFMFCPEVPPKVTMNEALDLAKKYSTDKSSFFINGVIDSIYKKLVNDNAITKAGRGLLNS